MAFMEDLDNEDYGFEFEDDDYAMDDNGDSELENAYYNAKQLRSTPALECIDAFESVLDLEEEKGRWGFKALKQMVKLAFKAEAYPKAIKLFSRLLTHAHAPTINRADAEKSINSLFDQIERASSDKPDATQCLIDMYPLCMESLPLDSGKHLWIKTGIRLARACFEKKDYTNSLTVVRKLRKEGLDKFSKDDSTQATFTMEICAIEMLIATEMNNGNRLKELYDKALSLKTAVPHPKTMGIVRECGGKIHMMNEDWKNAQEQFYDSFRLFDEAGVPERLRVVRYMVLAFLMNPAKPVDPFDSPELRPYRSNPALATVVSLKDSYMNDDFKAYTSVIRENSEELQKDPFFTSLSSELTKQVQSNAVKRIVSRYDNVDLGFVSKTLNIEQDEVTDIVARLIHDDLISGYIDETKGSLHLRSEYRNSQLDDIQRTHQMLFEVSEFLDSYGSWGLVHDHGSTFNPLIGEVERGLSKDHPAKRLAKEEVETGPGGASQRKHPNKKRGRTFREEDEELRKEWEEDLAPPAAENSDPFSFLTSAIDVNILGTDDPMSANELANRIFQLLTSVLGRPVTRMERDGANNGDADREGGNGEDDAGGDGNAGEDPVAPGRFNLGDHNGPVGWPPRHPLGNRFGATPIRLIRMNTTIHRLNPDGDAPPNDARGGGEGAGAEGEDPARPAAAAAGGEPQGVDTAMLFVRAGPYWQTDPIPPPPRSPGGTPEPISSMTITVTAPAMTTTTTTTTTTTETTAPPPSTRETTTGPSESSARAESEARSAGPDEPPAPDWPSWPGAEEGGSGGGAGRGGAGAQA